jgi:MOSC domain-containing protein
VPKVVALYRHPVKGFTPESCETLTVLPSGRVAGDRVLGIRFADTPAADDAWSPKTGMLALVNTPGLARLDTQFDDQTGRLRIRLDGETLFDEQLDTDGRARIAAALQAYVLTLDENPLTGHPERLPLRVVGDGTVPRYHDNEAGQVTLHGRASLGALAAATGDPNLSELRFRHNISIEGTEPWEEHEWLDRRVRIGAVEFEVPRLKVRCLATHANPVTGQRDIAVMTTLTSAFGQERPTFGIGLIPTGAGGEIAIDDRVDLVLD